MAKESIHHHSFPADVEAEILLRLPVKTLKRFQSVCKSWYSLISSPQFQKDHFHHAQHNPPLLLTLQNDEIEYGDFVNDSTLRFSVYNDKEGTLVKKFAHTATRPYFSRRLGASMLSCQGLICLSSCRFSPTIICNPSTEELISLPYTLESNQCVGFGYGTSTKEFKVVRFFWGKVNICCNVFALGTNHWREAKTPPPYYVYEGIAPFLHGALHFLPHIGYADGVKDTDYIAVFDIDTEEYKQGIPLPEYYYSLGDCEKPHILIMRDFTRLTKLGGSLCLTFDFGELGNWLELWLLKDYNNAEWVKGYHISLDLGYPHMGYYFWTYPTDTMRDESILLNCSDDVGVSLMCYEPQVGTITWIKEKEWASTFYVESFFPLGSR